MADATEATPCTVVTSFDTATLAPEWREAVAVLRRQVALGSDDDCRLVAITLEREGTGIRVRARSADGAETSRLVVAPRSLAAVTFGLLAGIPRERHASNVAAPDPLELPPPEPPSARRAIAPAPFDTPSRVTLSFATGARVGVPTTVLMAELELRADVVVHQWLLTLSLKADPIATSTHVPFDGDGYEETAIAFGVGREIRVGRSAFEITGGPGLAYTWMESDVPVISGEFAQVRVGAVVRWGYAVSSSFRFTVTVDGELVPRALVNDHYQAGLPAFPWFTSGLRLGGEVAL